MSVSRSIHPAAFARSAWFMLEKIHPSLSRVFLAVVLPLSLLPPLMLYYAGTYHGDDFMPGFAARNWATIAFVFFVAEMATVGAMGSVIRWIAGLNGVYADKASSYLLAFAAPVPLWLSSLALLVPSFNFAAIAGLFAFGVSCLVIYEGISVLLRVKEEVVASYIAYGVMASGLIAWALLLIIVIPL